MDLAAYRIVQESLTNAIRHAGPATAAVSLGYHDGELRVEVTDTGRGQAAVAGQRRSRAGRDARARRGSVGGTVEAGPARPAASGSRARLPLGGRRTAARLTRPRTDAMPSRRDPGRTRP